MIIERLNNFSIFCKSTKKIHEKWIAGKLDDLLITDVDKLENIGMNELGGGTNCSEYGLLDKEKVDKHIKFQEDLFIKLTKLDLRTIYFPKGLGIYGKSINETTMIPPTAYRLGYCYYQIKQIYDTAKRNIIVEIGGGWGALSHIMTNNFENMAYIIFDIPQSLINIGYILKKYGKNVRFCNEFEDINDIINDTSINVILALPRYITMLKKCDIVISNACMAELPAKTIDYYLENIERICKEYFYIDYTCCCQGKYLEKKLTDIKNAKLIIDQLIPITAYMCPYIENYGEEDIVTEKMFSFHTN